MNIHERLYRYFSIQRGGCASPVMTNLTGLYGAGGNAWLFRHCDVGMALNVLWKCMPRSWGAVALRWHFFMQEDEAERAILVADQGMQTARRENRCPVRMRKVWHRANNDRDWYRWQRERFEDTRRYADGMALLEALLVERDAV